MKNGFFNGGCRCCQYKYQKADFDFFFSSEFSKSETICKTVAKRLEFKYLNVCVFMFFFTSYLKHNINNLQNE